MTRRPWSDADLRYVAKHYRNKPVEEIAAKLNRSRGAVYQQAAKLGVITPIDRELQAKRERGIRRWHANGWSSREIGEKIGMHPRSVRDKMHALGLTPNGRNERYRKRVAATTRKQCKEAGVANLGELRSKEFKRLAKRLGWPDHLSLRAVQILETLYQQGPMTRRQIAKAIDVPWRGSRKSLGNPRVPGGSYLAELQRAGLVIRLESAITHKGSGNHQDLYLVALGVEPCQQTRKPFQSPASSSPSPTKAAPSPCKGNCDKPFSTRSTKKTSPRSSLSEKWGCDARVLARRIQDAKRETKFALAYCCVQFWRSSDLPTRIALKECGFCLREEPATK